MPIRAAASDKSALKVTRPLFAIRDEHPATAKSESLRTRGEEPATPKDRHYAWFRSLPPHAEQQRPLPAIARSPTITIHFPAQTSAQHQDHPPAARLFRTRGTCTP